MFKKLMLGAALSLTLVGGGIAATSGAAVTTTSTAVSQSAAAVQLAVNLPVPAAVQTAPLSLAEMTSVQGGDGWWKKFKKWAKKVIKKVVGVIVQEIIEAIQEWLEEYSSPTSGGEQVNATDVQTRHYASQYDYDVDNAYSDNTEYGAWEQTNVWYGQCADPRQIICD